MATTPSRGELQPDKAPMRQMVYGNGSVDIKIKFSLQKVDAQEVPFNRFLRNLLDGLTVYETIQLNMQNCILNAYSTRFIGDYLCRAPPEVFVQLDNSPLDFNIVSALVQRASEWVSIRSMCLSLCKTGLDDCSLTMLLERLSAIPGLESMCLFIFENGLDLEETAKFIESHRARFPGTQWCIPLSKDDPCEPFFGA